jgi:hypothetical protein
VRELKSKRTTRVLRPVSTVLHAAGDAIEQGGKLGEGAVAATEHVLRTLRKSHLGKGLSRLGQATKGAGDFVRDVEEGAAAVGERVYRGTKKQYDRLTPLGKFGAMAGTAAGAAGVLSAGPLGAGALAAIPAGAAAGELVDRGASAGMRLLTDEWSRRYGAGVAACARNYKGPCAAQKHCEYDDEARRCLKGEDYRRKVRTCKFTTPKGCNAQSAGQCLWDEDRAQCDQAAAVQKKQMSCEYGKAAACARSPFCAWNTRSGTCNTRQQLEQSMPNPLVGRQTGPRSKRKRQFDEWWSSFVNDHPEFNAERPCGDDRPWSECNMCPGAKTPSGRPNDFTQTMFRWYKQNRFADDEAFDDWLGEYLRTHADSTQRLCAEPPTPWQYLLAERVRITQLSTMAYWATGAGKTRLAVELVRRHLSLLRKDPTFKVVFLYPNDAPGLGRNFMAELRKYSAPAEWDALLNEVGVGLDKNTQSGEYPIPHGVSPRLIVCEYALFANLFPGAHSDESEGTSSPNDCRKYFVRAAERLREENAAHMHVALPPPGMRTCAEAAAAAAKDPSLAEKPDRSADQYQMSVDEEIDGAKKTDVASLASVQAPFPLRPSRLRADYLRNTLLIFDEAHNVELAPVVNEDGEEEQGGRSGALNPRHTIAIRRGIERCYLEMNRDWNRVREWLRSEAGQAIVPTPELREAFGARPPLPLVCVPMTATPFLDPLNYHQLGMLLNLVNPTVVKKTEDGKPDGPIEIVSAPFPSLGQSFWDQRSSTSVVRFTDAEVKALFDKTFEITATPAASSPKPAAEEDEDDEEAKEEEEAEEAKVYQELRDAINHRVRGRIMFVNPHSVAYYPQPVGVADPSGLGLIGLTMVPVAIDPGTYDGLIEKIAPFADVLRGALSAAALFRGKDPKNPHVHRLSLQALDLLPLDLATSASAQKPQRRSRKRSGGEQPPRRRSSRQAALARTKPARHTVRHTEQKPPSADTAGPAVAAAGQLALSERLIEHKGKGINRGGTGSCTYERYMFLVGRSRQGSGARAPSVDPTGDRGTPETMFNVNTKYRIPDARTLEEIKQLFPKAYAVFEGVTHEKREGAHLIFTSYGFSNSLTNPTGDKNDQAIPDALVSVFDRLWYDEAAYATFGGSSPRAERRGCEVTLGHVYDLLRDRDALEGDWDAHCAEIAKDLADPASETRRRYFPGEDKKRLFNFYDLKLPAIGSSNLRPAHVELYNEVKGKARDLVNEVVKLEAVTRCPGQFVKAVVISRAMLIGESFKNFRYAHLVDVPRSYTDLHQLMGRIRRMFGMCGWDPAERTVQYFVYVLTRQGEQKGFEDRLFRGLLREYKDSPAKTMEDVLRASNFARRQLERIQPAAA